MSWETALGFAKLGASLFKGSSPSPGDNIVSAAKGAMRAQRDLGINALEFIRGGTGNTGWQGGPRIGSNAMFSNSFDQISDILTGRQAKEDARQDVEDELRRIALDRAKGDVSGGGSGYVRTAGNYRPPSLASVRTDQGPRVMSEIADPTPVDQYGNIDPSIDDGGTGATLVPQDVIVGSRGDTSRMTRGTDVGEMAVGAMVNATQGVREHGIPGYVTSLAPRVGSLGRAIAGGGERGKMSDLIADYYTRDINEKPAIQWDDRFGYRKPDNWDDMDNKAKINWLRWNHK